MKPGVTASIAAALKMAGVSTFGDFLWAAVLPRPHPAIYGVIHGAILFLCVGLILGAPARRPLAGAIGAAAIGALASVGFYAFLPFAGPSVMFPLWIAVWVALGALQESLHFRRVALRVALTRGGIAAIAAGIAFYLVSGIWFPFDPQGWDFMVHFGAWTIAYFPGFAVLLIRGSDTGRRMNSNVGTSSTVEWTDGSG